MSRSARSTITLVGRAHSIDLTSDPVRLKITTRHSQGKASLTTDYRLQASLRQVPRQRSGCRSRRSAP